MKTWMAQGRAGPLTYEPTNAGFACGRPLNALLAWPKRDFAGNMKFTLLICCLVSSIAVTLGEKPLNLDDIERDNLASERRTKQQETKETQPAKPAQPQRTLTPTTLQFGFRPMKSTQILAPTHPQQQYIFPQALQFATYAQPTQYLDARLYQQYENVPYIVDNQVQQVPRQAPQYYTQQYVYLQPYSAASNNIQMVVDPKGNVKYYMYVPAHLVNVGPQIFTREPDYPQAADGSAQYITTPQLPPIPENSQTETAQSQPVQTQTILQQSQDVIPKPQYNVKGEPKSLLDSYVPSILQYQYYKQQQAQAQANAIKTAPISKTKEAVYTPEAASQLIYTYKLPPSALTRVVRQ